MTKHLLMWTAVAVLLGALLAGCGRKGDLEPPPDLQEDEQRPASGSDDG